MATRSQRRPAARSKSGSNARGGTVMRAMRWIWASAAAIFLILILLIVAIQWREQAVVRANVTAFGVDLSGDTEPEARTALEAARDERVAQPVYLIDGDAQYTYTEEELGLVFDIDGAVEAAYQSGREGFGASRVAAFWHLRGETTDVGVGRIAVAGNRLEEQLVDLAEQINQPRIDPVLEIFPDGTFSYVSAQTGRTVNVTATHQAVLKALSEGDDRVELIIDEYPPAAENTAFDEVREQLTNVFSGALVVKAGPETWTFEPHLLVDKLTYNPPIDGNAATLTLNDEWVSQVVEEISWKIDRQAQSARVWWDVGGQLFVMKDATPGQLLNAEQSLPMLLDLFAGRTTENEVTLPVDTQQPPPLPEDLNTLNFSSIIAEASTPYGGGYPARMHNIELAAQLLNGTVIMPGQTFSFNSEIGPMTLDAGFQEAFGITNEEGNLRTVPAEAGGICQVATTVFQPVFAGGYQIDVRSTHSYWIPNYNYNGMVGLDATVEPSTGMDFKWTNNSTDPILLQAEADGQSFTVRLIGVPPPWTVEILPPEITNTVYADTESDYYEGSTQIPPGQVMQIERATDGFDVKVVRIVHEAGGDRTFEAKVTYGTSRNVFLVGSESGELPADFVPPE